MNAKRTLIGKSSSFLSREAIWQVPEGIELQSKEQLEVVRRRVLFEDVLFMTYHREYGLAYLIVTGGIALLFATISFGIIAINFDAWPAAIPSAVIGLPAAVAFFLRLMFRVDIITVYGRRSKASIRFRFRKQRARQVYEQLTSNVRAAQARIAREIAAETPVVAASADEIPMPPEEDLPEPSAGPAQDSSNDGTG
jgi:hypothetical protein